MTIPLIFVSVIGVFAVVEYLAHRNAMMRLESSLDALIRTQAAALANPLWNLDDEQIGLALEAVVSNPEILSARVLGEGGEPMSEAGSAPAAETGGDLLRIRRSIDFDAGAGPRDIGTLEFVATRSFVWEQTWNRLLIAAVIALVAVTMEVAAALYALRTIIGRPLAALLASIRDAGSGRERAQVDWRSDDELGQVISAYNEMQARQERYETELRDARDTLEDRVAKRTSELAAARDESQNARARLDDAIEAIPDGFSLYDGDDRLVVANSRYHQILNVADDDLMQPGRSFRDILRAAVDAGLVADAETDAENWLKARLARHEAPGPEHIQRYANGRWVRVSERRTQDGGTVAVYSDITELKEREQELAAKTAQLEQVSSQLAKYLPPQVYESIFAGRQKAGIAATRKKLTVFFSDLADFTETADRLESEELTQLLNRYLTEMSRIALEHGGTVDKFVGDAILVFFGDPESRGVKEDASACVDMAIAMRQRMVLLAEEWRAAGIRQPLRCRMGIHTDFCTVGNFGSEDRLDYTIIGRGVNTASRLETLAKPGEILISYETYSQVRDRIVCEEEGEVSVKGLAYPVAAYRVLGRAETATDSMAAAEKSLDDIAAADPDTLSNEERRHAISRLSKTLQQLSAEPARTAGSDAKREGG